MRYLVLILLLDDARATAQCAKLAAHFSGSAATRPSDVMV